MPPMLAQVCVLVRAARAAGAATMPTPDHPTPSEVSARWADLTGCSCAPRTNKQIRKQYNKKRLKKSCCQITPLANMPFSGTREEETDQLEDPVRRGWEAINAEPAERHDWDMLNHVKKHDAQSSSK